MRRSYLDAELDVLLDAAEAGRVLHLSARRFRDLGNTEATLLRGRVRRGKVRPRSLWWRSSVLEYGKRDMVEQEARL